MLPPAQIAGQHQHQFIVTCIICHKTLHVRGVSDTVQAFMEATGPDYPGWTWRWSPSKESAELLCPDHASVPNGEYSA